MAVRFVDRHLNNVPDSNGFERRAIRVAARRLVLQATAWCGRFRITAGDANAAISSFVRPARIEFVDGHQSVSRLCRRHFASRSDFLAHKLEPRRFGRQRDDDIDPRRQLCRFALNAMVV